MAFVNRIGSLLGQNVRSTLFIYHAVRCTPSSKLFNRGNFNSTTDTRDSFNNFGQVDDARVIVDRETGITAMNAMDQKGSSLVASPTSATREFWSKFFGSSVIGFDLGTTDSCVIAMKHKVELGVPKDSGFEMDDKASDRTITLGRKYSDELGSEILSLMRPQKPSAFYHQGLGFLNLKARKIPHVRFYSSGGRNTNFGPKRTKFAKQFKGRMKGKSSSGTHISFGRYALQALQPAWVTARQIEAGRRAMSRHARSGGKIWVRVFPDKPITGKPAETRMGRGKGAVEYWTSVVKPGRILYEMDGVSEAVARSAILLAAFKMPIKTRFIKL